MKQLFKGIVPLILMLLVSNSGTATAQEKDQLVFPDITQAASLVNQNQFSTEVIEEVEVLAAPTETLVTSGNGLWYMNMKTNEASDGSITRSYQVTKNGNGEIISKIEQVDKQVVVEPTATTIQGGSSRSKLGLPSRHGLPAMGLTVPAVPAEGMAHPPLPLVFR